ncbi:hypothetical protein GF386_06065 [Candidatus Pacearchaeota archaeon]|nr:hypothetical protein [Candidatus Pacearchaeota archaeon]MBD3283655.1 hypothetical protein [Candidatus Pacearchaeota archaeon]
MQIIRVRLVSSEETKGCEKAPVEIIRKLKSIEGNEKRKLLEFGRMNLEEIHVDLKKKEEANYLVFKNSQEIFEKNFKSFFIGGDHSISYSILKAFNKVEKVPLLVIFDAHVDCISCDKLEERGWLRKLVEEGFSEKRVILISSRNFIEEEISFLKKLGIRVFGPDVLQEDLEGVCDLVMERARLSTGFYISIDIDCVDPAHAPGSVYLEPGGLSSRDLIYLIKRLSLLENFRGADIVNINPDKDVNEMTVKLGAKLLSEML